MIKLFKYPQNTYLIYKIENISELISDLQSRDKRIFTNNFRSDISTLIIKNNCMLIKFGYITVILFKNCCFIQSHLDTNSNKFISFIQESKDIQLNINSDNFSLTIFENILLYLSENIDTFLEESII